MKGTMKIISALLVLLMLAVVVTPVVSSVYATTTSGPETILKKVDEATAKATDPDKDGKIAGVAGKIIKIIRYVAVIIGVVLIAVFGLKFMLGSAEEKAEYKKSFVPLIIGIVVVFASTYIAQLIFSLAN